MIMLLIGKKLLSCPAIFLHESGEIHIHWMLIKIEKLVHVMICFKVRLLNYVIGIVQQNKVIIDYFTLKLYIDSMISV